jgi:hypothetical protein
MTDKHWARNSWHFSSLSLRRYGCPEWWCRRLPPSLSTLFNLRLNALSFSLSYLPFFFLKSPGGEKGVLAFDNYVDGRETVMLSQSRVTFCCADRGVYLLQSTRHS